MPNAARRQRNLGIKETYAASDLPRIRHVPEVRSAVDDRCRTRRVPTWDAAERQMRNSYGVVVLSVNVSVLLYVPVRSASLAPITWRNPTVTASLDTGPL